MNKALFRFDDKLTIPSTRKIQDTGVMIAEGAIARVGVLNYRAKELGSLFKDKDPESIVRVAQLAEDLFSEETSEKFRSAPITIGHPEQDVDTKNMKELGKGLLEGKPRQDGLHLAANLVLSDAEAIELVDSGVTELSVRAYYKLTRCDDSADYDAIRTISRVNHVAIVEAGRAGVTCRISDSEDGEVVVEDSADVLVIKDEPEIVVIKEEPKPTVVEELTKALSDALADVELKTKEVEVLKAELDAVKETVKTPEEIAQLVNERVEFISEVQKLSDVNISGMSFSEAKKAVVAKETGLKLDDKSPEYIEARYQILKESCDTETPMSRILRQSEVKMSDEQVEKENYVSPAEAARLRMIARNSNI